MCNSENLTVRAKIFGVPTTSTTIWMRASMRASRLLAKTRAIREAHKVNILLQSPVHSAPRLPASGHLSAPPRSASLHSSQLHKRRVFTTRLDFNATRFFQQARHARTVSYAPAGLVCGIM